MEDNKQYHLGRKTAVDHSDDDDDQERTMNEKSRSHEGNIGLGFGGGRHGGGMENSA